MTIVEAVQSVLSKYAQFGGRARRSEYWYFVLANFIAAVVLNLLADWLHIGFLPGLYSLAVLIPSIAVSVRRMHDANKSGWYLLMDLIPLVGWIFVLIALTKDSVPGTNRYGANPKDVIRF